VDLRVQAFLELVLRLVSLKAMMAERVLLLEHQVCDLAAEVVVVGL
jgi:hypothetical protein